MKTALQELIYIMENSPSVENGFEWKRVANLLLDLEEQHHLEIWCESAQRFTLTPEMEFDEYYEKKFEK